MQKLYDYANLIEKFLDHGISVQEFERTFLDRYREEKVSMSEELFQALDWFFGRVDAYTDLPLEPDDDPEDHISESQLRASAAKTLSEIRKIQNKTM